MVLASLTPRRANLRRRDVDNAWNLYATTACATAASASATSAGTAWLRASFLNRSRPRGYSLPCSSTRAFLHWYTAEGIGNFTVAMFKSCEGHLLDAACRGQSKCFFCCFCDSTDNGHLRKNIKKGQRFTLQLNVSLGVTEHFCHTSNEILTILISRFQKYKQMIRIYTKIECLPWCHGAFLSHVY